MEVSVQICILHQECGYGIAKLQKMFPAFPKTTVNRQMKKPTGHILIGKKKSNPGAPKRLKNPEMNNRSEKYE